MPALLVKGDIPEELVIIDKFSKLRVIAELTFYFIKP